LCFELWSGKYWNQLQGQQQNQNPICCHIISQIDVSPIDTSMHSSFNFQELHKGYWGVIKLLRVFNDFKLKWGMMGAHGCMEGCFCFEIRY
jgi:hypothetical protein